MVSKKRAKIPDKSRSPQNIPSGLPEPRTRSQKEIRSYVMSRVKSKGTGIEISLAKALWKEGLRYRKNYRPLPGRPDIALTRYRIAIFCDGDFWHGRGWENGRPLFRNNPSYWLAKIEKNIERDKEVNRRLKAQGWKVLRFWGRDIEKNLPNCLSTIKEALAEALEEEALEKELFQEERSKESGCLEDNPSLPGKGRSNNAFSAKEHERLFNHGDAFVQDDGLSDDDKMP
jgi:DNA mismatch endonuclease (patch repair protein)